MILPKFVVHPRTWVSTSNRHRTKNFAWQKPTPFDTPKPYTYGNPCLGFRQNRFDDAAQPRGSDQDPEIRLLDHYESVPGLDASGSPVPFAGCSEQESCHTQHYVSPRVFFFVF